MPEDSTIGTGRLDLVDAFVLLSELVQRVFVEAADRRELSAQQARLLGILRDRTPTMAQLAGLLDLDKSSTSGLVQRAERRGLVERVPVPEDGRSSRVRLTGEGLRLAGAFVAEVAAQLGALTGGFSPVDADRLAELITEVVRRNASVRRIDLAAGVAD